MVNPKCEVDAAGEVICLPHQWTLVIYNGIRRVFRYFHIILEPQYTFRAPDPALFCNAQSSMLVQAGSIRPPTQDYGLCRAATLTSLQYRLSVA